MSRPSEFEPIPDTVEDRPSTDPSGARAAARPRIWREVDPEDWASSPSSEDDRFTREVPPHWQ